jgi:hypothetical protein
MRLSEQRVKLVYDCCPRAARHRRTHRQPQLGVAVHRRTVVLMKVCTRSLTCGVSRYESETRDGVSHQAGSRLKITRKVTW